MSLFPSGTIMGFFIDRNNLIFYLILIFTGTFSQVFMNKIFTYYYLKHIVDYSVQILIFQAVDSLVRFLHLRLKVWADLQVFAFLIDFQIESRDKFLY